MSPDFTAGTGVRLSLAAATNVVNRQGIEPGYWRINMASKRIEMEERYA